MGLYEKVLGFGMVPFLFLLLILLSTGIARKQLQGFVRFLLSFNFKINDRTIYFFPFIAFINVVSIVFLYIELSSMHEPAE